VGGRAHPHGQAREARAHDLQLSSVGRRGIDRLLDAFRDIRGPLLVDAYLL